MTTVEIPVSALASALATATTAFSSSLSPRTRAALLLLAVVAFGLPTLRRNGRL
jgi:hypothetical protein